MNLVKAMYLEGIVLIGSQTDEVSLEHLYIRYVAASKTYGIGVDRESFNLCSPDAAAHGI